MWESKNVDLAVNTTTILPTAAILKGVYVNTVMSAHTCLIKNGADTLLIIPSSTAAGTVIDFAGEKGVLFDTNLIIDPDDSASGNITIFYSHRT